MKLFALIFCTLGLSAPLVLAADDFENLKAEAISRFVKQANTADSEIAKIIKAYNEENKDGRSPEGTIRLPVTRSDVRALIVSGDIQLKPFHYAEVEKGRCVALGKSATVLIALSTRQGAHLSEEFGTLTFTTSVEEHLSLASKGNQAYDCEEESEGAKVKTILQGSDFKQIKLDSDTDEGK